MRKRYQVFVSSTYTDLKLERQAAVEAILTAGQIPAGMELFTAGSQSQLDVIRRWIDESDLFLLILGTRYGSIEPHSQLSYTEIEFHYARKLNKPFFSIVLDDSGREAKVKEFGERVIEPEHYAKYASFREHVTSQQVSFFRSLDTLKLKVMESLHHLVRSDPPGGWVSAADAPAAADMGKQLASLSAENSKLRGKLDALQAKATSILYAGHSFDDLVTMLTATKLRVPEDTFPGEGSEAPLLAFLVSFANVLASGVTNRNGTSESDLYLFFEVARPLLVIGLMEHGTVPSDALWKCLQLSSDGKRFVAAMQLKVALMNKMQMKAPVPPTEAPPSRQASSTSTEATATTRKKRKPPSETKG